MSAQLDPGQKPPPIHQWTHTGDKVLIVKCVEPGGKSYNGFQWPQSGPVENPHWSRKPDCNSGGLFGWPWGTGLSDGKTAVASHDWIVFAARPENVIEVEGGPKVKAVPSEDGKELPEVVYYGPMAGAMYFTQAGRIAWIVGNAAGQASSGDSSSAASSGDNSSAASSGDSSSAASSGDSSSAASSGYSSSAASSGYSSSAASSGDSSSAASSGNRSSAASSGYSSSAASSGDRSSAASSGNRSSAKASGTLSIAAVCGDHCTVEASATSIAAVAGRGFWWRVHLGAVVIQRWMDAEQSPHVVLDSMKLNLTEGSLVHVICGQIQKE